MSSEQLSDLLRYSACDISDALLKLNVPGAGFLADIKPRAIPNRSTSPSSSANRRTAAPASTVLFASRSVTTSQPSMPSNVPSGSAYADLINPDTIVVLSQPEGQHCAVLGGIMAARLRVLQVMGAVVDGRVRDLENLAEEAREGFQVWSKGTSSVGAASEAVAQGLNVAVQVSGITIEPVKSAETGCQGDIIFLDAAEESVVAVPHARLEEVLALLPQLTAADEMVLRTVRDGSAVKEAFQKFRR